MYISIDSIIKEMLLTENNPDMWYSLYLVHALNGVKELTYDIIATLKTDILSINANGTVDFPEDYLSYTKIGIVKPDGNIKTFAVNENMCLDIPKDNCGIDINPQILGDDRHLDISSDIPFGYYFYNYQNGLQVGSLFGQGGGYNRKGHYRIDERNRLIVLSSEVKETEIVLEYVTNGMTDKGKTMIHEWAKQSLIAWIRWQHAISRDESLGKQQLREKEYEDRKFELSKRKFSFTIDEFKYAYRTSFSQSFKN